MAESESGARTQNVTADGVAESTEDVVVASLEENVVTDPNPIVGEEDGDPPGVAGLPESCVDKAHNGHSSPDLAEVESSGNGATEVVAVASQGNMSDNGKQDEVTSAKTVSNVGGEISLKTSVGGEISLTTPVGEISLKTSFDGGISLKTSLEAAGGCIAAKDSGDDMHMKDPTSAPCDLDISEVEKDDDADKSRKALQSTTYADVARVKEPAVSTEPSSPSSIEAEPKSSDRPRREGNEYTESSPKDSATPPKPGDISEEEPKKEGNNIMAVEPKKIEKLISPKPIEDVGPSNTLTANNKPQSIEEYSEKSCAKKLDKLTEDGESMTPKEDGASANQPGNEMERESSGSEQSEQLQIEKSKTMSNVVNNSLDNIQHDVETTSSDNAESNELQKETAPISEQLPDDSIPEIQGNDKEHEIAEKPLQEKKVLSTSDSDIAESNELQKETAPISEQLRDDSIPGIQGNDKEHEIAEKPLQEKKVLSTSDPETESVAAAPEVRRRIVSHQSPTVMTSQPLGIELTRAKLHSTTEPAQDLHGDTTHPTRPSLSTDKIQDTSEPDEPTKPQPTNCERMILILLLVTIALFGGIVVLIYVSDHGESNILETVQDSSFIVSEETIVLQSQLWDGKELNILVIGRLGTGKSTLLRGLFEKNGHVVPLSLDRNRDKPTLNKNRLLVNDVPISLTVWNHPKLENVGAIIKLEELQKFDVILYTIKMSETRFPPKDSNIMKTMLEILGTDFVSKTVFILSHANQVGSLDNQNVHQKTKSILENKTHQWKEMIINKLNEHSKEDLKPEHFVHAGHPNEPKLYDVHWPSQVLAAMFDQLDESRRPALAKACEKYWISALQGNYEPGSCAS